MKTIYEKYKGNFVYGLVAVVLIGGAFLYFKSKDSSDVKTFTVSSTSIEDKVSFSGNVIPADKVDLSFEKTGRISSLAAYVGKQVYAGEVLATISTGDSQAQLEQAKASLMAEEATLASLKRGARPESVDVAKTKVTSAERSLADGLQGVRDALTDAYTKADDAVHNTLDPLYSNDTTSSPTFTVLVSDSQLKNTVESARVAEEKTLALWKIQNDGGYSNLDASSLATLESYLSQTKSLLDAVAGALATGQSSGSVTQSNLDTWRASVGTARTTISTSINKVNTAQQTYSNAQSSLTLAKQDLVVLLSGASTEDVSAEEARVASAQAKVFQYQVEVGKSVLYSPIDGVVTTKDTQLGEIVSANQHIVSVISNRHFQIESNVSELDIGKLLVGQFATTTLDAYGSDVPFPARVIRVDPAETTVENSPAYGIRLEFVTEDARIKSGMTANISIAIAHKDGVLAVPLRTINKDGVTGKRTVSVLKKDKTVETRDITIGLTSPAGMVEVVTGLKEDDLVVLPQGL